MSGNSSVIHELYNYNSMCIIGIPEWILIGSFYSSTERDQMLMLEHGNEMIDTLILTAPKLI